MTWHILAKSSVLILKTPKEPIMTDLNGKEMSCPGFTIADDVDVAASCAVTYKDQFFVYGGYTHKRQIAKVTNKSLINIGYLPFDFFQGGCSSTANKIILCFDYNGDLKTCYQTTNPTGQFKQTTKSIHSHRHIKFASSECKFIIKMTISSLF